VITVAVQAAGWLFTAFIAACLAMHTSTSNASVFQAAVFLRVAKALAAKTL